MKRKFLIIGLILISAISQLSAARYKFDYDLTSDIRKTIWVVYKFKLFYHASASAYFTSKMQSDKKQVFNFSGFPDTGYRIRTHRKGTKLSVVTAAYSFSKAKAAYARRIAMFRREAPYYARMNKTIARRPFKILPTNKYSMYFTRYSNGKYGNVGGNIKMVKPSNMSRYNDSFNIYKLMKKMIQMMGQPIQNGNRSLTALSSGKQWRSPWMNFGSLVSRISYLADYKGKKYFKYRQKHSCVINYRVLSKRNGKITILGSG